MEKGLEWFDLEDLRQELLEENLGTGGAGILLNVG